KKELCARNCDRKRALKGFWKSRGDLDEEDWMFDNGRTAQQLPSEPEGKPMLLAKGQNILSLLVRGKCFDVPVDCAGLTPRVTFPRGAAGRHHSYSHELLFFKRLRYEPLLGRTISVCQTLDSEPTQTLNQLTRPGGTSPDEERDTKGAEGDAAARRTSAALLNAHTRTSLASSGPARERDQVNPSGLRSCTDYRSAAESHSPLNPGGEEEMKKLQRGSWEMRSRLIRQRGRWRESAALPFETREGGEKKRGVSEEEEEERKVKGEVWGSLL
ncbi:unnamed protein product, partial [Pleuronectes platessa]